MREWLAPLGRLAITLLLVAVALLVAVWLWHRYERDPWTRDGHIRADVVRVTPDVSGLVTQVAVRDNQRVKPGDLLFVVDRPRFALALAQADAAIASARATLNQARRESARDLALGDLVAAETHEQNVARAATAAAALAQAQTSRDQAVLNLQRTTVRATVNGTVTNLDLHPGDYVAAGQQALALVDDDSIRVEGYFEETKLPRIRIGDPVRVQLMGDAAPIHGHVDSITAAISDSERTNANNLLPTVNPTFAWVRLAQRIPVRVKLDRVPAGTRLIAGRTATVTILPRAAR
ncbi:efflux RND transporter periplasmic adaptor subunit [Sphingomonas sp. ASY06-1R]|jgi:RND family efflux transporter MFP subunit|uniref:efflux RND transporter periplasmic adaptor subunit n=1 Tax=Sphingomonas sp. ASY06-1R TaxID=3445771 RepID=UPI003FA1E9AA